MGSIDVPVEIVSTGTRSILSDVVNPVIDAILGQAGDILKGMLNFLVSELDLGSLLSTLVNKLIKPLSADVEKLFSYVLAPIRDIFTGLETVVVDLFTTIASLIQSFGAKAAQYAHDVEQKIVTIFDGLKLTVSTIVGEMKTKIRSVSMGSMHLVSNFDVDVTIVERRFRSIVDGILNTPASIMNDLYEDTKALVDIIITDTISTMDGIFASLKAIGTKLVSDTERAVEDVATSFVTDTKRELDRIATFIENDARRLENAMGLDSIATGCTKSIKLAMNTVTKGAADVERSVVAIADNIKLYTDLAQGVVIALLIIMIAMFVR